MSEAPSVSVLVVDDEASIRETTAALLEDDYTVTRASSGRDALRLLGTQRVDVICTDFRMPGMTGIELLRQAQKLYPGTAGILVTAYADYPEHQATFREVPCLVLLKPYDPEQLCSLVERSARLARMKRVAQDAASHSDRLTAGLRKG
jgi:DNA-binding NtrC family response regulator